MVRKVRSIKNKSDVQKFSRYLEELDLRLDRFSEHYFKEEVHRIYQQLKIKKAQETFKSMPVDTLSSIEKGLPITALIRINKHYISDIENYQYYDFKSLNGIGEVTANELVNALAALKHSVIRDAQPRLDVDNLSQLDYDLIRTLYIRRHTLSDSHKTIEAFDHYLDVVQPHIETGLKQKNVFMQLFQSRTERNQIEDAISKLNENLNAQSLNEVEQALNQFENVRPSNKQLRTDFIENNAQYYVDLEMIGEIRVPLQDGDLPADIVNQVNNFELHTEGLDLTLRHYQAFGAKYALIMKRTLLGDEMGLGKTIQALAVYHHLTNLDKRHCIVVCPLSVTANWKREIEKFSNHPAYIFHGNSRDATFNTWQNTGGIIITTYEHTAHMNFENAIHPDFLVVDEAHFVKNKNAKRSKNVYALSELSEYVLFMSGTPLENRLDEMKQLIGVLQPEIARSITQELHVLRPKDFKAHIAPVYLRRNREDVLGELPDLEVIEFWSHLSDVEERNYYQAVSEGHMMNMRRAAFSGGNRENSAKLDHLLDICEEAHENGHKVLVFSYFRDVIDVVQRHLKEPTFEPITGDVPNERRQEIIDEFSKSDTGSVLCLQIVAGGVGLNIQAASTIILCEPQWKPSTEVQAIGRAYRMGQTRKVIVYRLLSENTIDSSMLEILGDKAQLFDMYAKDSDVAEKALPTLDATPSEEESIQKEVMKKEQERLKVMQ